MDYKSKYNKYKQKYLELKTNKKGGSFPPDYNQVDPLSVVDDAKSQAHKSAYELLKKIITIKKEHSDNNKNIDIYIGTAESLTAGLMFSTLVDIPFGGAFKYGCFGVYNTDAKRVFIGVDEPDVYTHNCAKQMAVGILLNSNATLGIAVTGNSMPTKDDEHKIGEVFIGIATYVRNPNSSSSSSSSSSSNCVIKVSTSVYNFCENESTCNLWYNNSLNEKKLKLILDKYNEFADKKIDFFPKLKSNTNTNTNTSLKTTPPQMSLNIRSKSAPSTLVEDDVNLNDELVNMLNEEKERNKLVKVRDIMEKDIYDKMTDGYNEFQITSIVSQIVRNLTVSKALDLANEFITANKDQLVIPEFVINDFIEQPQGIKSGVININESNNKHLNRNNIHVICVNDNCLNNDRLGDGVNNKLYGPSHREITENML